MKKLTVLLLIWMAGAISSASASTITIELSAGQLTDQNGVALPANSLLLLVALGADDSFYSFLSAGQFVGGDDVVLGASSVNENNGTMLSGNEFIIDGSYAGQSLGIRWFSDFTLAQYEANETTVAGNHFGTFAGVTTGTTNGGDAWIIPGTGVININFVTQSANTSHSYGFGDAYSDSVGQTLSLVTVVAVPEPSEYALTMVGLLCVTVLFRLNRRVR